MDQADNILAQIGTEDFQDVKGLSVKLFSELLGTLVHITILLAGSQAGNSPVTNAMACGFLIASVVTIHGDVSGGFVNPAITVGAWICGYIKLLTALCYIGVQIIGSVGAVYLAQAIKTAPANNTLDDHGTWINLRAVGGDGISVWAAFGLEMIFTFLLVSVVVRTIDPERSSGGFSGPMAIGISITAAMCAVPNYKASMNPANALADSINRNDFSDHWVYWVGPLVGAILAGLLYRYIFSKASKKE